MSFNLANKPLAERAALGIPPLPLTAQQTADVIELLKNPPAGEAEFLLDLITNRVPAGVDDAAKVKASYLAAIAFGSEKNPLISRARATEQHGGKYGQAQFHGGQRGDLRAHAEERRMAEADHAAQIAQQGPGHGHAADDQGRHHHAHHILVATQGQRHGDIRGQQQTRRGYQ